MTFLTLVLLLLLAAAVAVIVVLLRRPRQPMRPAPVAPSPYARDDAFGRPDPAWGSHPAPSGMPAAGGLAGGLAAGLALGAGAVAAQEIGRRMFDHGGERQAPADPGPAAAVHEDARHSQLARDAGIGAFDPAQEPQGLLDAGGPGGDDGGADDGGWDA